MTKLCIPSVEKLFEALELLCAPFVSTWMRPRIVTPLGLRLPPLALDIYHERHDLRKAFDLAARKGRQQFSLWLMFHGFPEMDFIVDNRSRAALSAWQRPWPKLATLGLTPITWLMREAAKREGITTKELQDRAGQMRLLRWYFLTAMAKYNWSALLTDAHAAALMTVDDNGAPVILNWLWEEEPDVRARFGGPTDPALREWLKHNGANRWRVLCDPRIGLATLGRQSADVTLPFGVNLVGYPRGRFGIGEDVRMAAQALAAVGVPFTIRDIGPHSNITVEDASFNSHVSDRMPFRFTIFCTTGMDMIYAVNLLGPRALEGQVVIGFWPWELPEFPDFWRHAYSYVDEVWASSRYTHDAYVRSATVPVRHMPMAVTFEATADLRRGDFGLPADRFLFLFAYDALSYDQRKNPKACLTAFDRAFPRGDEPVGLVIKGLRADGSEAWRLLKQRAARDPRLFLVESLLERGEMLDLYRACDCFLSLHRAEGFGRNIAECMGLGLPVIVTAHSGNMDFTRSDTAALVPVRLRQLAAGDYPYGTGQIWAEPDADAAAALMRRIVEDDVWREQIATTGQRRIVALYSPETVGRRFIEALSSMESSMSQSGYG
ncbi:glycosyltransferase [Sphingobium sp. H33]|uniref:Glycosyltransferase n=2 Tax=Sphingobium nicotianae TaxID=2782607 RepID=A0A9X1DCK0_9SPHN|nr:glycosyltransferase [Sphingobium nicotianae]